MSEVKPPTSASLREARELLDKSPLSGPGLIALARAFDSAKRAALGQAAEIAENMPAFDTRDWRVQVPAAIRALMEGD